MTAVFTFMVITVTMRKYGYLFEASFDYGAEFFLRPDGPNREFKFGMKFVICLEFGTV